MDKENIIEKNKQTIVWIYSQWKWDFWFVDVEWQNKWYFVFSGNKNWALDWDKVEASVKVFKNKEEAVILKVIERKQELIVWEYISNKGFGFVVPRNKLIKNHIFVPGKKSMDAKTGDIVWVLVTNWNWKNPEWRIKEILWKKEDKNINLLWIIIESWVKLKFSEKIFDYVKNLKNPFSPSPHKGEGLSEVFKTRKDLTSLFTFTIDWEDAKDLDDAISIEKLQDWKYKLYVHIADVSYYVSEKSVLDIEAYKRATSIYLVDRVIPMLPEKISNDLCSLNPNTKKLTLTCEMIVDNFWKIIETNVYNSIISSDFRLTYKEVDEVLSWKILIWNELLFWWKVNEKLIESLKNANILKAKITEYRENIWVLNFDFPETKIKLDEEWNPIKIEEYPKYDSNKLIEEFMVSANESISKKFSSIPFLYRIHEDPKEDDLAKLQDTLNLFEVNFKFKKGDTKEFSNLLKKLENVDETKKIFLEKIILRTLSKAIYSHENVWHFGLWLEFYSHFTSPIRRYPDLQIHRIIKEKISWNLTKERLIHYKSILDKVSNHTSEKERKAEKLEYKVKDYFIVKYYKNKVWQEFDWIITWVIQKWFFVWLQDTAEWFVELIKSDFNEDLQEHIDFKTRIKYRLWNKVKVRLIEVDEELLRLNFEIV